MSAAGTLLPEGASKKGMHVSFIALYKHRTM
jgi:hypothetical protein